MRRLITVCLSLLILASCAGSGGNVYDPDGYGSRNSKGYDDDRFWEKVENEWIAIEGRDKKIPITLNDQVKESIEFFREDAPRFVRHSLGRSYKYKPMMEKILREKGLPLDLVYLSMIESGYRVDAVSPANAVGLWQFIAPTGKRYGLRIDDFVDERMHPEKSTAAAADYLKELHEMFGSYYLAAAAYNCGEGKILKGLKKYSCDNFWELSEKENFLRNETKLYVPRLIAAIIIAKDPARYGFTDIKPEKPDEFDVVNIPTATDIDVIAEMAGVKEDAVRDLNPHLKLWCTPLDAKNYEVKIPKGTQARFNQGYAKLAVNNRMKVSKHTVQSGETLKGIAKAYGLSSATLKSYNGLRSTKLKKGQVVKLPVDPAVYQARMKEYKARVAAEQKRLKSQEVHYTVRKGDNPWLIAKKYDLNWKDIAQWNDIKDVRKLRPGDELVLYLGSGGKVAASRSSKEKKESKPVKTAAKPTKQDVTEKTADVSKQAVKNDGVNRPETYTVKDGETVWRISLKFSVKPEKLREVNGLKNNSIRAGQVLKIAAAAGSAPVVSAKKDAVDSKAVKTETARKPEKVAVESVKTESSASRTTYTVKKDDTLWRVAQDHKVTPEAIKDLNGLKSNSIRPGQVLKLPGKGNAVAQKSTKNNVESTKQASNNVTSYKVKDGDTLWKIAQRFKVNPAQIRNWNSKKNDDIRPGEVLTIKTGS